MKRKRADRPVNILNYHIQRIAIIARPFAELDRWSLPPVAPLTVCVCLPPASLEWLLRSLFISFVSGILGSGGCIAKLGRFSLPENTISRRYGKFLLKKHCKTVSLLWLAAAEYITGVRLLVQRPTLLSQTPTKMTHAPSKHMSSSTHHPTCIVVYIG